jgi:putative ABC exporter
VRWRGVLLGRARALRNSIFRRGRSGAARGARGPLTGVVFVTVTAWFAYSAFAGLFAVLDRAGAAPAEARAVLALALDLALVGLLIFDLESAVSTLILDRDLDLLRVAPLEPGAILGIKLLDALPRTFAPLLCIALPALVAYAGAGPHGTVAWLVALPVLALLWAIPLGAGVALTLVLLARVPARRAREMLGLVSVLAFVALWIVNFVVLPRAASGEGELLERGRALLAAAGETLARTPGGWAADLIAAGAPGFRVRGALMLIATAGASLVLARIAAGRLLAPLLAAARTPAARGGARARRRTRFERAPFLLAVMRRDRLLFTRDWPLLGDVVGGALLWALLPFIALPILPLRSPELVRGMLLALAVSAGWGIGTRAFPVERDAAVWMRLAPVPARTWAAARLASTGVMALAPVALAALSLGLAARLGPADWLATLATVLPAVALSAAIGLWLGAIFGDPHWTSAAAVLTLGGRLSSALLLLVQTVGWVALTAIPEPGAPPWPAIGLAAAVALAACGLVMAAVAKRVSGYRH